MANLPIFGLLEPILLVFKNEICFVSDGGIHAREMAPPEVVLEYAHYLLENYKIEPDIHFYLDYVRTVVPDPAQHRWLLIAQWEFISTAIAMAMWCFIPGALRHRRRRTWS